MWAALFIRTYSIYKLPNIDSKLEVINTMSKTFHICNIVGIPLKIHWSFGLTILFVTYIIYLNGLSIAASVGFALLVLVMFICVILHELGHCLAARRYGIDTLDIIISPIGGLARLKDIPREPIKELVIALAGPAVNVFIAFMTGLYLHFIIGTELLPPSDNFELLGYSIDFLKFVFFINIMLFVFNLVPAFPMDGGRVLRALLSMKFNRLLATRVAMWIARVFALIFVLYASYTSNILLGIIGVFVYVMSGKEYAHVKTITKLSTKISEIIRHSYTKIFINDSYNTVIDIYNQGKEKNFLVYKKETIVGSIPKVFIEDIKKSKQNGNLVSDLMSDKFAHVSPEMILRSVIQMMNQNTITICAVEKDGEIIGVLDRHDIQKYMR